MNKTVFFKISYNDEDCYDGKGETLDVLKNSIVNVIKNDLENYDIINFDWKLEMIEEKMYVRSQVKSAIYDFCCEIEKGFGKTLYSDWNMELDTWFDSKYDIQIIEEETIPITYGQIKNSCGWSDFCDVTGHNHYAVKEYGINDREIFDVKISHAKILNFIK